MTIYQKMGMATLAAAVCVGVFVKDEKVIPPLLFALIAGLSIACMVKFPEK